MTEAGRLVLRLRAAGCVFAEDEVRILMADGPSPGDLESLVVRRELGEPLEQVVGWADLCGHRILLDPGVFVPRRRTELMVREALHLLEPGFSVLDLCCGSGAVAAVLNAEVDRLQVYAVDVDGAAVRCARRNLGPPAHVYVGDLFTPLPTALRGLVDLVVANAPYVPTDEIRLLPPEARLHEPGPALDGGTDGLDVVRRVVAEAPRWLASNGCVVVEASRAQAEVLVGETPPSYEDVRIVVDEDLGATVVIARVGGRSA